MIIFTPWLLCQWGRKLHFLLIRRLGWPKHQSVCFAVEKNLISLPEIEPQTIQPVAKSRYTLHNPGLEEQEISELTF
jgi:hypothetical protein